MKQPTLSQLLSSYRNYLQYIHFKAAGNHFQMSGILRKLLDT